MTIALGGHTALEIMRAASPLVLHALSHGRKLASATAYPEARLEAHCGDGGRCASMGSADPRFVAGCCRGALTGSRGNGSVDPRFVAGCRPIAAISSAGATLADPPFLPELAVRPRARDNDRVRAVFPFLSEGPLEVVVPEASLRSGSRLFSCCVEPASLLGWTVLKIADGVYICHPALVLVQLARTHKVEHVASVGSELCGAYRKASFAAGGFVCSRPLASRQLLLDCIGGLEGVKGLPGARSAIRCTFDGARSPMESDLAVLFGAPVLRGGYDLGPFEMNGSVEVPRGKMPLCAKSYYLCDFLWRRERVVVEYDSDLCHTGSGRIADDAARRNALSALGFNVLTLTKRQLLNRFEFTRFMATLEAALGRRRSRCSSEVLRRKAELWFSLVGHFGAAEELAEGA